MPPIERSTSSSHSQHLTAQTEGQNRSQDGPVKSLPNSPPIIAGQNLGQHLDMRGLKAVTMVFTHPKATFDLATGRLARMRNSNPARYLKELNNLSTSGKHCQFVLQEGGLLKEDNPDLRQKIEEQQITSAIRWLKHIPKENFPARLPNMLEEFSTRTGDLNLHRFLANPDSKFSIAMRKLTNQLRLHKNNYSVKKLESLQHSLKQIAHAMESQQDAKESFTRTPLGKICMRLAEREQELRERRRNSGNEDEISTAEQSEDIPPLKENDVPSVERRPSLASDGKPDATNEPTGAEVVAETDAPGSPEIEDVINTAEPGKDIPPLNEGDEPSVGRPPSLVSDGKPDASDEPTGAELVEETDEPVSPENIKSLLTLLLQNPDNQDLWASYDAKAKNFSAEQEIDFLYAVFKKDIQHTEATGRLLNALLKQETRHAFSKNPEAMQKYNDIFQEIGRIIASGVWRGKGSVPFQ